MSKFAKLFDLPNEHQVLLTLDYEEEEKQHVVIVSTSIKELSITVKYSFNEKENAKRMLNEFTMRNALKVFQDMLKLWS